VKAVIGNRGRSIGDTQQPLVSTGEPPTIRNLAEYLAAMSVDGIRGFPKTGNARIPAGVDAVGLKGSFTSRTGGFHHDQPGATGGSGLMVGRHLFGWAPIPRHHGLVRGGKDAVAKFEAANLVGREQMRKRHIKPRVYLIASNKDWHMGK
jgi:hypothetical protein